MKKIMLTLCCFFVMFIAAGCSGNEKYSEKDLKSGSYVGNSDNSQYIVEPTVVIKENKEFLFFENVSSSHIVMGSYSVDSDSLVLKGQDGETLTFEIGKNSISFNKEKSNATKIEDGAVFTYAQNVSD